MGRWESHIFTVKHTTIVIPFVYPNKPHPSLKTHVGKCSEVALWYPLLWAARQHDGLALLCENSQRIFHLVTKCRQYNRGTPGINTQKHTKENLTLFKK